MKEKKPEITFKMHEDSKGYTCLTNSISCEGFEATYEIKIMPDVSNNKNLINRIQDFYSLSHEVIEQEKKRIRIVQSKVDKIVNVAISLNNLAEAKIIAYREINTTFLQHVKSSELSLASKSKVKEILSSGYKSWMIPYDLIENALLQIEFSREYENDDNI